jgi:carboxyl-terminal processing protease
MKTKIRRLLPHAALVVATALVVTAFTGRDEDDYFYKLNRGLELFGQVYREIAESYVDEIEPEEFIAAGIEGMLKTLDPYTVYMRRKESADIELLTSGSYGGIGITVGVRDSAITIVDIVDGYSAQREGLRIGDQIMSIDGADVLRIPLDSLREYTRGDANTTLTMSVLREGAPEPLTFVLTRENIRVRSVAHSAIVGSDVGYIRLERFGANAGDEVGAAIADLKKKGATGFILDMRDNPGGLLESAVDVASKFVPKGSTIVTTRGRDSSEERVYRSSEDPMIGTAPLVVVVDGGSASAAEIVAAAVQDLDAGVILGAPTFGKGLVQSVRRLPHDATLKLTTARYYTPSGRCIQKQQYVSEAHLAAPETSGPIAEAYHTARGRKVTAQGGIMPDTVVVHIDTGSVLAKLLESSVFFDFATRYSARFPSLPAGFRVDDAIMAEFEAFALRNFAGDVNENPVLARAKELEAAARSSNYDPAVIRSIEVLQAQISSESRRVFAAQREQLRRALQSEIIGRFHGQKARYESSLGADPQVMTAVGLVHTGRASYERILSAR